MCNSLGWVGHILEVRVGAVKIALVPSSDLHWCRMSSYRERTRINIEKSKTAGQFNQDKLIPSSTSCVPNITGEVRFDNGTAALYAVPANCPNAPRKLCNGHRRSRTTGLPESF